MPSTTPPAEIATAGDSPLGDPASEAPTAIELAQPRNLLVLAGQQIMLRVAWIFKTESVIMPAFLDTIAGAGWIRGCLPVLNRIGQSVPPMLLSDRLRAAPVKSRALLLTSLLMSGPFLLLAGVWFSLDDKRQPWLPWLFLLLYFIFFCFTGLNQLSFGTVQGKLVAVKRRGRLLALSGVIGSFAAIGAVWFLLPRLLERDFANGFGWIFLITGVGFSIAGAVCLLLREPPDDAAGLHPRPQRPLHGVWLVVRRDRSFRRLAVVAMLFITAQFLFPHYQKLGYVQLEAGGFDLMVWVVAQNAGAGVFSLLAGAIADRFGNRLAIRMLVFVSALTPLLALAVSHAPQAVGRSTFWLTFFLLGLIPVTLKALVNYALEIAPHDDHPRYVSTLSLCLAVPFVFSPLAGLAVDLAGFTPVLLTVATLVAAGGLLTFRMSEPRHGSDAGEPTGVSRG
ncbi:MAG: MFS transporter [Pirellulaceae bacterium]